jgi:putative flippase GtrA
MALKTLHRFIRYCTVGVVGVGVKIGVLAALIELARLDYMTATGIAVEIAILHSFLWHLFWTWRDRSFGSSCSTILSRLVRFHIANGAVGFAANLILMRFLVETLGLHYLPSNLAATGIAGLTNFLLSEFFVFVSIPQSVLVRNSSRPAAAGRLL